MKRNRKGSKRPRQTIQVWTYEQALRVLPYVASIVRSLREHRLEAQRQELIVRRLARCPGRPKTAGLIAHEAAVHGALQANERFHEALEELHTLDIFCLDPIQGQALIPFAKEDQLAWFVFDLFDNEPLRFWRYHEDPLETRRPVASVLEGPADSWSVVV